MSGILNSDSVGAALKVAHSFGLISAAQIRDQLDRAGLVLLSGKPMNVLDLETFTYELFSRFHQPASRATLWTGGDGFSTSVEATAHLLGHAEGHYRPCIPPPDACIFMCAAAPPPDVVGGETLIVDGSEMLAALPRDLAERLKNEEIIYECHWERPRWEAEFHVQSASALRKLLDADRACRYELDGDDLHLLHRTSALLRSRSGQLGFVNGLLAHLPTIDHPRYAEGEVYARDTNRVYWADGGLLTKADVNAMIDAHDQVAYRHRWTVGDVLIFDNSRFLHGRTTLAGTCDRLLYSRFGYREALPIAAL